MFRDSRGRFTFFRRTKDEGRRAKGEGRPFFGFNRRGAENAEFLLGGLCAFAVKKKLPQQSRVPLPEHSRGGHAN